MTISVIIPALNEETALPRTLARTFELGFSEIIIADGGSIDRTRDIALQFALSQSRSAITACPVMTVTVPPGRALQMNAGAQLCAGEVLLFLHADTVLPKGAANRIAEALRDSRCVGGRFDVQFDVSSWLGTLISKLMNLRSRLSGIATGDQAIFVRREIFEQMSGFANIPLMEDVDFTRRLKRFGTVAALKATVITSYRRWTADGPVRTILLMWGLRLLYWLGVSPHALARFYRAVR